MLMRRIGWVILIVAVLAVNWMATLWWLSGQSFGTAQAQQQSQVRSPAAVQAAVIPPKFSYQGTLRDANGNLINRPVTLTVALYKDVTGGIALHTESFPAVNARNGVFSIVVGDNTPIAPAVFDNFPLFLGIRVNQDPEMLPRQRLHPVPWAMQATTAQTAVTANNLAQGGGVPNLVTLGAGGASEITFGAGGKITNSGAGLGLNGGANKTVTTEGALTVGGDLTVQGSWSAGAIRDVGDSNGGQNVTSIYPVRIERYVVEAVDNGASPDTVPISDTILTEFCQDFDGCTVNLAMRDWTDGAGRGLLAAAGPFRLTLAAPNQGKREWDLRNSAGGAAVGVDGNGAVNHALEIYSGSCYFTDGEYVNAQGSDNSLGFGLLNWFGIYNSNQLVCVLIIED